MATRRPRLVYLYTEVAQRGIHHICCRQLLAALEREFDVTAAYTLFPDDLVHAGLSEDLRDRKAITRLATGFLKLLFPDMNPTEEQFREYCVRPAVELRQRVRDELHKMDPEYVAVQIGVE